MDEFIHKIGFNGWHIGGVLGHIIPRSPIVLECITYNCAQTQTNWKKKKKDYYMSFVFSPPLEKLDLVQDQFGICSFVSLFLWMLCKKSSTV
jgi:hypothetical protein